MCFSSFETLHRHSNLVVLSVYPMEYPLPGPVVALLQQEKASLAPKSYFISSGKKSIKITLVYIKGELSSAPSRSLSSERKKLRNTQSSKPSSKPTTRRTRSKNLSESSSSTNKDPDSSSVSQSDAEQARFSPDLNLHERSREREGMSTVDSGHPSSLATTTNDIDAQTASDSEVGYEQGCYSLSSSDSEKPRTPGREIAVPASTIGPGETPASRREEMWQTWTRIPRNHPSSRNFTLATLPTIRDSVPPSTAFSQRTITTAFTQRRTRLHESAAWEGSGNL